MTDEINTLFKQNDFFMLTVPIKVGRQFVSDILTTATEGGSQYWLQGGRIDRSDGKDGLEHLSVLRITEPQDVEEGGDPFDINNFSSGFEANRDADITLLTIVRGLQRLFEAGVLPGRPDIRGCVSSLDAGNIDAEAADVILQLGFFGDTVYG